MMSVRGAKSLTDKERKTTMTQEDAIRKAMACLRLAKSSNPNEAALAASKAQEIIDAYKLDITGLDYDAQQAKDDNEPIKDFHGDPLARTERWDRGWALRLASVIARANQCRVYYEPVFTGKNGVTKTFRISIIGRPSDVSTVRYLNSYLKSEVNRLNSENNAGNSESYRQNYCYGVVDAIQQKLKLQRAATEAELKSKHAANPLALVRVNSAIVRIEKRALEVEKFMNDELKRRWGKVGKGRSHGNTNSYEGMTARQAGRRDGQNVRFTSAKASLGRGVAGMVN